MDCTMYTYVAKTKTLLSAFFFCICKKQDAAHIKKTPETLFRSDLIGGATYSLDMRTKVRFSGPKLL